MEQALAVKIQGPCNAHSFCNGRRRGPGAEPACTSRRSVREDAADGTAGVLVVLVLGRDRVMST